jgi:hypothetical protein
MKRHWMNVVRTAMAIVLVAGVTCSIAGCDDHPFKNGYSDFNIFGH